ncbi:unnamed protein product, partial [Rotaria socialis]
ERIKSVWIVQDQHYMCTLLHPSLKYFEIAPNEKSKAIALVRQELLKRSLPLSNNITATDHEGVATNLLIIIDKSKLITSNYLLTRCFDQLPLVPKPVLTPTSELDNYMSSDIQVCENDDVLLFWKENTELFPILSSMVRDLFAIPASNTTVESSTKMFFDAEFSIIIFIVPYNEQSIKVKHIL